VDWYSSYYWPIPLGWIFWKIKTIWKNKQR